MKNTPYTNSSADRVRRDLARLAMELAPLANP